MKIDLYKLFGVKEGEEFKIKYDDEIIDSNIFKIKESRLYSKGYEYEYKLSRFQLNLIARVTDIIKLPKKKEFTDDELCILRNIDKEYKWVARDEGGNVCIFIEKPLKKETVWDFVRGTDYIEFHCYNHLFQSIQWEDEEPVFIDDYVER